MAFSFPLDRAILIFSIKKSHNYSIIFHLWRLWRSKPAEICKIHWKLKIFKSQYCFANISALKPWIFIKFETNIYNIVKNQQMVFCKDPCLQTRTRGSNVRTCVLLRQNARAHVYASFAWVCAWIFTKNHVMILYYIMTISLKFYKDPRFQCRDICKTILTFKTHQFSMYFVYFHKYLPPKPSKMDYYWMIVGFIGN